MSIETLLTIVCLKVVKGLEKVKLMLVGTYLKHDTFFSTRTRHLNPQDRLLAPSVIYLHIGPKYHVLFTHLKWLSM